MTDRVANHDKKRGEEQPCGERRLPLREARPPPSGLAPLSYLKESDFLFRQRPEEAGREEGEYLGPE
jgi:hypothetical protein